MEFDLDIDPNIYLDYNPFETTIKFAPANLGYARYGGRSPSVETPPRVLLSARAGPANCLKPIIFYSKLEFFFVGGGGGII